MMSPHEPMTARWACTWAGSSPVRVFCIVLYILCQFDNQQDLFCYLSHALCRENSELRTPMLPQVLTLLRLLLGGNG
jgi:hypothetical protein